MTVPHAGAHGVHGPAAKGAAIRTMESQVSP